jgi:hypothetical protein
MQQQQHEPVVIVVVFRAGRHESQSGKEHQASDEQHAHDR